MKKKNLAAKGPSRCNAPTNRDLMSVTTPCPSPLLHRAMLKIEQNFAPQPIKNKGKTWTGFYECWVGKLFETCWIQFSQNNSQKVLVLTMSFLINLRTVGSHLVTFTNLLLFYLFANKKILKLSRIGFYDKNCSFLKSQELLQKYFYEKSTTYLYNSHTSTTSSLSKWTSNFFNSLSKFISLFKKIY